MEVRICPYCDHEFIPAHFNQRNCKSDTCVKKRESQAHQRRYTKLKKMIPTFLKDRSDWARKNRAKMRQRWGSIGGDPRTDWKLKVKVSREAEEYVATKVLPAEGFSDPYWINRESEHCFLGDMLAKKDGQIYCINVTINYWKQVKATETARILDYLGLRHIVVFVKPDLTGYVIREIPAGQITVGVYSKATVLKAIH